MVTLELNNKAFTLIELLIVLGLVIVIFTIVTFGLQRTYLSIKIHHELYILKWHISEAKHESIHLKKPTTFVLEDQYMYVEDDEVIAFQTLKFDGTHLYTFHANGNISSFNTVDISTPLKSYKLIFHIGSGHHEIR